MLLGVHVRLEDVGSNRITFEPVSGTLERLAQEAQARLSQGSCTSAQAAKLRGQAGWAVTVVFARAARHALALLKWMLFQDGHITLGLLVEALTFLVTGIRCVRGDSTCADAHHLRTATLHGPILLKLRRIHRDWDGCSWNLMVPKLSPRSWRTRWLAGGSRESNRSCAQKRWRLSSRCTTAPLVSPTDRYCGSWTI